MRCQRKLQCRCSLQPFLAPALDRNLPSVRLPPPVFAAMGCKSSVQVVSFDELGDKGSGTSDCPAKAACREASKCAKKRPSLQVATQQLDPMLPHAPDFKKAGRKEEDSEDLEGSEECGVVEVKVPEHLRNILKERVLAGFVEPSAVESSWNFQQAEDRPAGMLGPPDREMHLAHVKSLHRFFRVSCKVPGWLRLEVDGKRRRDGMEPTPMKRSTNGRARTTALKGFSLV
ncbi:nahA [Symbiodinium necroappetens]|uniref:NahA protein n=1 Tax=Symbiodinium necroappetens TaxID=1628268 RepID=A0A812UIN8_9DINO|nr:nahA [Symbiodinium necroappetens]